MYEKPSRIRRVKKLTLNSSLNLLAFNKASPASDSFLALYMKVWKLVREQLERKIVSLHRPTMPKSRQTFADTTCLQCGDQASQS